MIDEEKPLNFEDDDEPLDFEDEEFIDDKKEDEMYNSITKDGSSVDPADDGTRLMIAEKVYKKIKEDDLFSDTPTEHLNNLIGVIRKEIKGTKFKLKYNFIDFDECLTKPLNECAVKIDISLMPSHKNKDEYILWLAGFIERMTTGGETDIR